jgi:hypothetical protein
MVHEILSNWGLSEERLGDESMDVVGGSVAVNRDADGKVADCLVQNRTDWNPHSWLVETLSADVPTVGNEIDATLVP